MLEQLAQHEAKATFFCVGENAHKYPEIIKAIREHGHSIGNHTYNHLKGWSVSSSEYLENTMQAAALTSGNLFRPPYGRITQKQAGLLNESGFRIVMWTQLSCDYMTSLDIKKSLNSLIKNAKPGNIVVFHDSEKALHNLNVLLPQYLSEMTRLGYQFKAL